MSSIAGWHSRDAAVDDAVISGYVAAQTSADTADCVAAALCQGKEGCRLGYCPGDGRWVHLACPCTTSCSMSFEAILALQFQSGRGAGCTTELAHPLLLRWSLHGPGRVIAPSNSTLVHWLFPYLMHTPNKRRASSALQA